MAARMDRRQFVTYGLAAVTGLALSACGPKAINTQTPPIETPVPSPTPEVVPYLPFGDRLSDVPLPDDVITPQNLWTSFHTRIWQNQDTRLYLRAGVVNSDLFKALAAGDIPSLDIVLFEEGNEFTQEQRDNLPPEFVEEYNSWLEFSDKPEVHDKSFSGKIYQSNSGHCFMLIRRYSPDKDPDFYKSYPEAKDVTNSNLGSTFRHELNHYPARSESGTGYKTMDQLIEAQKKLANGDDSGYYCLVETKEGLIFW
jgi:hypothetical protein